MEKSLLWIGRAVGAAGALLSLIAVAARASGQYFLAGAQVGTLLLAATAAMVFGCLCLLVVLTGAARSGQ